MRFAAVLWSSFWSIQNAVVGLLALSFAIVSRQIPSPSGIHVSSEGKDTK